MLLQAKEMDRHLEKVISPVLRDKFMKGGMNHSLQGHVSFFY